MSECKDNMKKLKDESSKKPEKNFLGLFPRRKTKFKEEEAPKDFASSLLDAEKFLTILRQQKEIDIKTETGCESINMVKKAMLDTMQFHIEGVCDLANQYADIDEK